MEDEMHALSLASALMLLGVSAAAMAGTHQEVLAKTCAARQQECLDDAYAAARACLDHARSNDDVDACDVDLRVAEQRCGRAALECQSRCGRASAACGGKAR
jgi:hypothetical protein